MVLPDTNYEAFNQAIIDASEKNNKQCTPYFLDKVQQLYEMIKVRQGVMISGHPFGGKTTAYRILAEALSLLEERNGDEHKAIYIVINPKALTMGQLYGQFDSNSHEWSDGILAVSYRNLAISQTTERKWLLFDGPVDTVWIENLNTVLDDNKKLCLMSGEIIHLAERMNLIFEPLDLEAASPATISRCGIIYMEPSLLGWEPLLNSWKNTLPPSFQEGNKQLITAMFMRFCPLLLWFVRKGGVTEMAITSDSNLICSLINLFDCFMDDYYDQKYVSNLSDLDLRAQLEGVFFFSCVWALGGALNEESREKFSELFHAISSKEFPQELEQSIPEDLRVPNLSKPYIFVIPKGGTVFDYRFIKESKGKWKPWADEIASAPPLARDVPVNQIIITTIETIRISTLVDLLVRHGKPLLLVGPTGTGKSAYIADYLLKKIDSTIYTYLLTTFSAQTMANQTQDIIMGKLDKRRKGVYGPPVGKKCVIFVDDISMPMKETYGAQSSIELLRMWLDHWMWYDRKNVVPIKLLDIQLICAMGLPTTGNTVSARFTRHFNTIAIDEFNRTTLISIFSKIVLWHLDARGFSKEFDPCIDEIVMATLYIYMEARKNLLPTPAKCHYMFNLRDFSRVIQGVLLSVPEATEGIDAMRRLWSHEIFRVYGDRLIDTVDRIWLFKSVCRVVDNELHSNATELFARFAEPGRELDESDMRKLMYCDFTNPKADTRNYLEVQDLEELRIVVEAYLVEFNNMSKRPMTLVLFRFAIEHLSRICRIIKQPRSHAMLIGIGGSGRQSLTRLAAHITDYTMFYLETPRKYSQSDWHEDLKQILRTVSANEVHGVFLFTDMQFKEDSFLEDVNNLLNSGEVPNLLTADDKTDIVEKMRQIDSQRDKSAQTDGTYISLYNFYIQNIREQLHIVICLSPIGAAFRNRVRKFPAIVNCCTIDWFQSWPPDALLAVSTRFLDEEKLTDIDRDAIINMCIEFHTTTQTLADEFFLRLGRHTYVTPTSYLEMILTFKQLLLEKRTITINGKTRYETGIKQLDIAAEQLAIMQEQLEIMEPQLKIQSDLVTKQTAQVQAASDSVEDKRAVVNSDEMHATECSDIANEIAKACAEIMGDAVPMIKEAELTISSLTPADIAAVRTLKTPPIPVKIVMEAVCILKEMKPEKVPAPSGAGTVDDYWGPSKKVLGDPKFLDGLLKFDRDAIPATCIKKLHDRILNNEAFDPDKVKLASTAAEYICKWVLAIVQYEKVAKIVEPKRTELKEAEDVRDVSAF